MFKFKKSKKTISKEEELGCKCCGTSEDQSVATTCGCSSEESPMKMQILIALSK